ncbi:sensor histidine kinase [Paenibacillus sedimenti]|uniref:histidine kinase n=1 Tax=Paenibacillus sedimenti TaxID=2770274 RepID=A0A926QIR1_9BACL|nr:HAMP domain-containing sensor histidine kinase [Paenibacillus sedimenti]MBD0379602.1 HAMP domain-containing histidine kinase [Paenibacillus sedimenti]
MQQLIMLFNYISHTFYYYAFLMFTIVYSNFFTKKHQKKYAYILVIPCFIMVFFYPWGQFVKEDLTYFIILLFWTVPYNLLGCILLILSYLKEKNRTIKRNRLFIVLIFVPGILSTLVFVNLADVFYYENAAQMHRYAGLSVSLSFLMFIVFSILNGVIFVRKENDLLNNSVRVYASGAEIMNHTIKNETVNIMLYVDQMKALLQQEAGGKEIVLENIERLTEASQRMLRVVNLFRGHNREIKITPRSVLLEEAINQVFFKLSPAFEKAEIMLERQFVYRGLLFVDVELLQEAIQNLLQNAMEAYNGKPGAIRVETTKRRMVEITVSDQAGGIPEDMIQRVTEAFFSTKNVSTNHGIGLHHVDKIMKAHRGKLEISNIENGASVTMKFPMR